MSAAAAVQLDEHRPARLPRGALGLVLLLVSLGWLALPRGTMPRWAMELPRAFEWPLARQLTALVKWLVDDASLGLITVRELTRGIAAVLEWPLWLATGLFATGFSIGQGASAVALLPPLPWLAVVGLAALIGHYARDLRLAVFAGCCFLYLALFGQWHSAMVTLASIAVAVPLGAAGGLLIAWNPAGAWLVLKLVVVAAAVLLHLYFGLLLYELGHDRDHHGPTFYRVIGWVPLLLLLLIAAVTGAKPLTLGNLPAPPSGVPEVEERVPGLEEGGELPPLELPGS